MPNEVKLLPCEEGYELANWLSGWMQDKAEDFSPDTINRFHSIVELLHSSRPTTVVTDEVVERLRNALEPFAKAADIKLCGEWADDKHFSQTDVGFALTFGDLREARDALASMPTVVTGEQQGDVTITRELYAFLMGEGPLEGVWFGDLNEGFKGAFWWRALLRCAAGWPEPPAQPGDAQ